ncbi:restriction endonuclease subunit S [Chromobacterium paludis]|uniref:Type I restriction endonuclease subunit S n=1 Tax=Chromobacterium paludis TaxID=2605945 RepID=A0A5C1DKT3_9NEIS|nr:restriction endonuclease subunit S [Chromobacterium paludis]QEL57331.1 type I restriction endonuclease subunit S [Chromobacterium paludis]
MSRFPGSWIISELQDIVPAPQQDIIDGPFGSNLKASEYVDAGVPIIRLQNVSRCKFIEKNIKYLSRAKSEQLFRHNFLSGDIVITKLGDPLGKAAIVPPALEFGIIVADIVRLRINENFANGKYIAYAINSPAVCTYLASITKGTTRQRVNLGNIRGLSIPLAPLPEQKRIADKLDSMLARVDACRERLARVQPLLKRFRQSVLAAATSGRLTEDWRAERAPDYKSGAQVSVGGLVDQAAISQECSASQAQPGLLAAASLGSASYSSQCWAGPTDNPANTQSNVLGNERSFLSPLNNVRKRIEQELKGKRRDEVMQLFSVVRTSEDLPKYWYTCPVGVVGLVLNGSTPSRADVSLWGGEIPWVSSGEVRNNLIHEARECISQAGFDSCSVKVLPKGSVLIAMIGEGKTRGQSAILKIEATINQNIAAVVPFDEVISSEYLWYSFQAKYEENRSEGSGTGPQALNCQRVRELLIHLPPLEEQYEIVRRVETLFAFADRLEARLAATQSAADKLTPSLLAKAFRGELVPQDPNDEPAAELLKRLAAQRAAVPKPKRGRKAACAGD